MECIALNTYSNFAHHCQYKSISEAYSELNQTSKVERFLKIVNG